MQSNRLPEMLSKITVWSLYVFIFAIPFSKSITEISAIAACASYLAGKVITRDFRLKKTPLNFLLLALFITGAISIVNTDFKLLVARSLVSKYLKYIILYFAIVESVNSFEKLKDILVLAFISAIIVTGDSFIQYYLVHQDLFHLYPSFKYAPLTDPNPNNLGFPTGPFPFPNDLSSWMLIVLFPSIGLVLLDMRGKRSRIAITVFLIPFLFLFYLANTRSAWLGFLIAAFLWLLSMKKVKLLVIILLLAVLIATLFLPPQRITDILGYTSMEDRFYMWRIGWKIFLEHPIIGNGFNTFFLKFKEYREDEYRNKRGSYAHNAYLQIASDTGILGIIAFLSLICAAFINALIYAKKTVNPFYKALATGLAAGLVAFLIQGFFDTNLQSLPLISLFWFSIAILMSLEKIEKTNRPQGSCIQNTGYK